MLSGFSRRITHYLARHVSRHTTQLGPAFQGLMWSDALMLLSLMVGHVVVPWWITGEGGAHDMALYGVTLSAVSFAAMPLLSPLGDRHPKRWLIVGGLGAVAFAACGVALLATVGHYHLGVLIALQVVPVLAMAVILPASLSMTPELVPAAQLAQAIGAQQTAQSLGRLLGPALGGGVLAWAGTGSALWLHGALLVAAAAVATRLPSLAPHAAPLRPGGWWADLCDGLRANWAIPLERGWLFVNFVSWVFLFPALTMLVPLKVRSLGLSAVWLGLCEAALSLGMLAGALGVSDWWIRRHGRLTTRVGAAVAQGMALAVAGFTTQPELLVAAYGVAGLANSALVLVGMTHRMLARPAAFRARMSAGAIMTSQVAATLGPGIAGAALTQWSVSAVYTVFGLAGGLVSLGMLAVPGFRSFLALTHDQVDGWYLRTYPAAFTSRAGAGDARVLRP